MPTQTLRIVQLIDSLEAGGAERMAVNYANALTDKIAFSGLIATRKEGGLKSALNSGVDYLFANKKNGLDFNAFRKIYIYCTKNKINYIHAHSSSFFWAVLVKFFYPRVKIIWHDHYGNSEFLNNRPKFLLKLFSVFFNLVIVVNNRLRVWVEKNLKAKKVKYLFNFAQFNKIENTTREFLNGESGKKILCLANLRPQKNHKLLLKIARMLKKTHPDWSFHLVGKDFNDTYSNELKEDIKKSKLEQNVYVYGSSNNVTEIINECSFGLLTSLSEGLPVSLIEYGLLGKTVVSSNVGDVSKIIINNETGFLIEDFSEEKFYNAIVRLIKDNEFRIKLELAMKENVEAKFSSEAIIVQYLGLLK